MEAGPYFAGVELGGTKSIALLAQGRKVGQQSRILTPTPQETLRAISDQLLAWREEVEFAGLGIASFGPIELAPRAARYGHMLRTPKAGWQDAGIAQALTSGLDCPWKIDTDVNAAALAEYRWGAGVGLDSVCYVTIGTGVGGGLVIEGMPVHGALHPEMGHLRLRRAPGDAFPGACPFHGDCIEGLVSGPALAARMSCDPAEVPDDDERWPVGQDQVGRLWDVLWVASRAAHRMPAGDRVWFQVYRIERNNEAAGPLPLDLKMVIGAGDTASAVITIMLPDED